MQNKANFRKAQMNVKPYNTTYYENIANWTLGENKPNQTQFPNPHFCTHFFEYFQTFSNIFEYFTQSFEYFQTFSNVFERFFLTYFAQTPQLDKPTPIFTLKTNIAPKNNLKKPYFSPNHDIFSLLLLITNLQSRRRNKMGRFCFKRRPV